MGKILTSVVLVAAGLCTVADAAHAQAWKAHGVPLLVSASNPSGHQGFVRIINHSNQAGEVLIHATDDAGMPHGPVTLQIGAMETAHLTSDDLEQGNTAAGPSPGIGAGTGDWRLRLRSLLDIEVLAYNRTGEGLLAPVHNLVPRSVVRRPSDGATVMGHRVATFNPGSNTSQVSRLRITNPGGETATVTIEGVDDNAESPGTAVQLSVPAGASRMITAQDLESGQGEGLVGALGDGEGGWQLVVTSDQPLNTMNLLTSPTGHLTNLSTARGDEGAATHDVPLFASASNSDGYEGFVRIINHSDEAGEVQVEGFDDTGASHGPATLRVGANQAAHFDSGDLELGNAAEGLWPGIGAGTGDWRLRLSSSLDIEVLAYNRTNDGLVTSMSDLVPYTEVMRPGGRGMVEGHHVPVFIPATDINEVGRLRIINPNAATASVFIDGIDDAGESPGTDVRLSVPAGASRTFTSQELESEAWAAGSGVSGALGDGDGMWRLVVTSDRRIDVMSLLASPTGHLVNLSTDAPGGEAVPPPAVPVYAAVEVTGKSTTRTGTPLVLIAKSVGTGGVAIDRFEWTLPDGRTLNGEEVSVSFAEAGLHAVDVKAISGSAVVAETSGAVAVFDAAAQEMPGFEWVPEKFGDVGMDGGLGLDDLVLAAQGAAGHRDLDDEAFDAADLDLSGSLDERDIRLLAEALLNEVELPSAILDDHAYPAGVVAMVSPALLDPDADATVSVGGVQSPQLTRTIPGYASFVVPDSLTGQDAEVDVVVEVDAVVSERLKLLLKPTPDMPAVSAKEDVLAFLDELGALVARQEEHGAGLFEETGGLSPEDTAIVLGAAKAAEQQLEATATELEALLNGEGGEELAAQLQASLYASGLAEFRASIATTDPGTAGAPALADPQTAESGAVVDACANLVPAICRLKKSRRFLNLGSTVMLGLCSAARLARNQYTIVITAICIPTVAILEVASLLAELVHPIDMDMTLSSDKDVLRGPQRATIEAEIKFLGLHKMCSNVLSDVSGKLDGEIITRLTKLLLRTSPDLAFFQAILEGLGVGDAADVLFSAVEKVVGAGLSKAGLDGAFENAFEAVCLYVGIDDTGAERHLASLPADGKHFDLRATEPDAALTRNEDGVYELTCPEDFSGTLSVVGSKPLCVKPKRDAVPVTCSPLCRTTEDGAVYIPDPALLAVIREGLDKAAGDPITPADMALTCEPVFPGSSRENCEPRRGVWNFDAANGRGIRSLTGIECATGIDSIRATDNQITALPSLAGFSRLTWLDLRRNQLSDVSTLSELSRYSSRQTSNVSLPFNQISVVPPLAHLSNYKYIEFYHNRISDVSPFAGLTNVEYLNLHANRIRDISPLATLYYIDELDLRWNQISDVSPLLGPYGSRCLSTNRCVVKLEANPLSTYSIRTVIPELRRNGATVTY